MTSSSGKPPFFIGWDVGGWNCDKNAKSRDAIVILDDRLAIVGLPWRGNLRASICEAETAIEWIDALFAMCKAEVPGGAAAITMAIDTPLGLPYDLVRLVTGKRSVEPSGASGMNQYLFRQTECRLFEQGMKPLSAIKDMIGSQATKGMHVLAKFSPTVESCGVWTDGASLRAIETYPTACRGCDPILSFVGNRMTLGHPDKDDALICARIAHLFATDSGLLQPPPVGIPDTEGWIWVPKQSQ